MTRSNRFTRSPLLLATLLALAGCGTETGDPLEAEESARIPRGTVIRVVPDVPLPTEGFGNAVAVTGTSLAVADFVGFPHAHVHTYALDAAGLAVETGPALRPDSGAETCFGEALGMSGNVLVVGAPCADGDAGAAYVYQWDRAAAGWLRLARLTSPIPGPAAFGKALAVRPNRVVVGAPYEAGHAGAVHVFARNGATLSLEASISLADGAPPDLFGWTLAVSGEELAVGAPGRTSGDPLVADGRVHLFARVGGVWTQGETLLPCSCQLGERTGWSVALAPGVVVIAGDRFVSHSVHVYELGAAGWEENDVEEAIHGAPDCGFVHTVAIDGDLLVIGTPTLNGPAGEYRPGAATLHRRASAGVWPRIGEIRTGVEGDKVGHAVAVAAGVVAVGAPGTYLLDDLGATVNTGSGAAIVVRP